MARQNGRNFSLVLGGTNTIAVMETHNFSVNLTPVDVTGYTDKGFITLLSTPGSKQITFDASGQVNDTYLRLQTLGGTSKFANAELNWLADDDSGDVIYTVTVDLHISVYTESGVAKDGALKFSASFASSGAWVGAVPVV